MKYAIFFTWKDDGFKDTFICNNAKCRDMEIADMVNRGYFTNISYEPIYANGERGKRITVVDKFY